MLAEYIWVDGSYPYRLLRSKTKVIDAEFTTDPQDYPLWSFDGSSTNQAEGSSSDCVLKPIFVCKNPFEFENAALVLCEVLTPDMKPHPTNTRSFAENVEAQYFAQESLFGLEQEYTLFKDGRPLGFPENGYPEPQGKYYCGVGADRVFGRNIVENHLDLCLTSGLKIGGVNAEVMPGQWEFQIGPLGTVEAGDQLHVARYILERVAEGFGVSVSYEGKPMPGDWNGAGCHTNFSTKTMRTSYEACLEACESLGNNVSMHIANYGHNIEDRLTGKHETCSYEEFRYGVSDRTASIRLPLQATLGENGYIEDRRPNADCDPYKVCGLILKTVMEH
jgi:glutamine synthetase